MDIAFEFPFYGLQEEEINVVDELHMTRKQVLHQTHWPLFHGLGQDGMVGEGVDTGRNAPSGIPVESLKIDEDTHQFWNTQRRVRVV
jgi:hypothetical protein